MKRTVEQLAAFNDIAKALTSTLDSTEVLNLVMEKISLLLKPTHWSLLLEGADGQLYFEVCVGPAAERLKGLKVPTSEGIAGAVFKSGQAKLVNDAKADPSFSPRFDEVAQFETRSVLAVPLLSRGRPLGVIELVNNGSATPFSEEDLRAATAIAEFAAIAIDNARNYRRVQELTITDDHTGLFNARHLSVQLEKEVARSERFGRPFSLLFLDLDHFKQVNDRYGHLVGSATLKEAGEILLKSIRAIDSAYRYGGDEFAVLLLETNMTGARAVAQRIVEHFRKHPFDAAVGLPMPLTVSIGVASFPDHARTPQGLLATADQAMYRAKAKGRNMAEFAGET